VEEEKYRGIRWVRVGVLVDVTLEVNPAVLSEDVRGFGQHLDAPGKRGKSIR